MIQLGLRLHDAEKLPMEELLPIIRAKGYSCAHLALSKAMKEYPCHPAALTPGYAHYLKRLFEKNEMDIALLGCYRNLTESDHSLLRQNQEQYISHFRFASLLGCGMVGTETPMANFKNRPDPRSDEAFSILVKNLKPVVKAAQQFGIILALEPVARHVIWCPKRARQLLDEIASPNLQILFDPVNLLDLENVRRRDEVFAEAIELLGPDIAMVHLKDFQFASPGGGLDGSGLEAVGAGTGEMDFTFIMKYLKKEKPFIYATLENTTPENAAQCRKNMQALYESV